MWLSKCSTGSRETRLQAEPRHERRAATRTWVPTQSASTMDQDAQIVSGAKQQVYRLLAYRSQTSCAVWDRLQRRDYTAAIIDEVLRQLAADGYIDDRQLALDWARYRLQTKPLGWHSFIRCHPPHPALSPLGGAGETV
jgi:RecX, first three-helix domain